MNEANQDSTGKAVIETTLPSQPSLEGLPSALEALGASPFPKSGFPLLGFLATLYDQVAGEQSPQ